MSNDPLPEPIPDPGDGRPGHFDRFGVDNMVSVPIEFGYLQTFGHDDYRHPASGTSGLSIPAGGAFVYAMVPPEVSSECWPNRVECHITLDGGAFPVMFVDAPLGHFVKGVRFLVTGPGTWNAVAEYESL